MSTIDVGTGCAFHLKIVVVCLGFPWLEQGVGLEGNAGVAHAVPPLFHRAEEFLETVIGTMVTKIVTYYNNEVGGIEGRGE